jgi:hypothetical protein
MVCQWFQASFVGRLTVASPEQEHPPGPPDPVKDHLEPHPPLLSRPRRPHRYRWVLFLFVVGLLAILLFFAWRIIAAWMGWLETIEEY